MAEIIVVKSDRIIQVTSRHHPDLAREAKALGGVWTGDSWAFDITQEEAVRNLYLTIFGEFKEASSH